MKFKYCANLSGDKLSCEGYQLVELLSWLQKYYDGVWYIGDLTFNEFQSALEKYNSGTPLLIGDTNCLIEIINPEIQLFTGVFLLFTEKQENINILDIDTEAALFENFANEIIQIRAFDTSYFEVYTYDSMLINEMKNANWKTLIVDQVQEADPD